MIVCLCRAVCEQVVDEVVTAGASSVDAVTAACGAGGDCGACWAMISDRIEHLASERYAGATL